MELKEVVGDLLKHYNKLTFKLTIIVTGIFFWLCCAYPERLITIKLTLLNLDDAKIISITQYIVPLMDILVKITYGIGSLSIFLFLVLWIKKDFILQKTDKLFGLLKEVADCLFFISYLTVISSVTYTFLIGEFFHFNEWKEYLAYLPFILKIVAHIWDIVFERYSSDEMMFL